MATQGLSVGPPAQQNQLQQGQPHPQQQSDSPPGVMSLSWEGDRMFNIYIYDYCTKRGFHNTARELCNEAEIPPDSTPPINAKQGLLFEWWSVFWVLFTAKSNNSGPEDALMYTQHQAQQAAQRQTAQRLQAQAQAQQGQSQGHMSISMHSSGQPPLQPSLQLVQQPGGPPLPQQPGAAPIQPGQPQAGQPNPQQPPMGRMPNGMPRPGGPGAPGQPANGPSPSYLPNGPVASPLPNGVPGAGPFPGQGMPNGFNGMAPGQRPTGAQTAQRAVGPNGLGHPFQHSPTMAHSPGASGQPGQGQGMPGPQVSPMGQLGPSPHMMQMGSSRPGTSGGPGGNNGGPGGMIHPGMPGQVSGPGSQAGIAGGMPPGQNLSQTPVTGFAQLGAGPGGRPPSRTTTPGGGGMMVQQSPSMMNRQIPGGMGAPGMASMGGLPGMQGGPPVGMPPGGMQMGGPANIAALMSELNSIPPPILKQLKSELGIPDREPTMEEKSRIVQAFRQGKARQQQAAANAAAGPSGQPNRHMQPPGAPGMQRPNQPGPPQPRPAKRNSTSPPEEHESLPRPGDNSTSPGSRKRQRRATPSMEQQQQQQQQQQQGMFPPQGQPGQPPQSSPMGGLPQQPPMQMRTPTMGNAPGPGGMGGPPTMGPMSGGGPNGGFNQQMGGGMGQMPMNGMMSGGGMSPAMNHPPAGGMITPQMQQMPYRPMQAMHKTGMPGNAASPSATEPSFNQQQGVGSPFSNARIPPGNKPMGMMPPPPPSPGMGGQPKDGSVPGKDSRGPDGSPQNQPMGRQTPTASGGSTAPPTPGGSGQTQNPAPPPAPGSAPPNLMGVPSPGSMMNNPPMGTDLFPTDFLNTVASSLEDFDPAIFRPDGDINFERDFGQWFNDPEHTTDHSNMDMNSVS